MTIASQTSRISYTGDGSTTAFAVPFYFAANTDLVVVLQDTLGNQTTQVLGTNYNLTGATLSAGGTCTFTSAPASGYLVSVYRDPPVTQTTSYNNNDPFPAKSHEAALDKLTTIAQRAKDMVSRSLEVPDSDAIADYHLPTSGLRKNKLLGFDSNGLPIAVLGPSFVGGTYTSSAIVDTRATAVVTTFAGSVNFIITGGLVTVGDRLGGTYVRGTGTGSFTDGGGVSWKLVTSEDQNSGTALVESQAVAATKTFPPSINFLVTGGLTTAGDDGASQYVRGTGAGSFTDAAAVSWVPTSATQINRPAFGPVASPFPYAIGDSLFTNAHVTTALPSLVATAMGWGSITTNAVSGATIADQASIYGFQRTPNVANPTLVWLGTNDVILDGNDNRTTEQTSLEGLRALLFHLAIPTTKRVTGQAMTVAGGSWANLGSSIDPNGTTTTSASGVKRGTVTGRHVVVAGWMNTSSNGLLAVTLGNDAGSTNLVETNLVVKRSAILTNSPGGVATTTIPFVRVYKNVGVDDDSKTLVSVANVSAGGAGNDIFISYVAGLTGKQDEAMPLVMCSNLHDFTGAGEAAQGTNAARRARFNWGIRNIIDEMVGLGLWGVPVDAKSVLYTTALLGADGLHPQDSGNTALTTEWATAINNAKGYYKKRNSQLSNGAWSNTLGSDIQPRGRFVVKDFQPMVVPRASVGSGFSAHNNGVNTVIGTGSDTVLPFSTEVYDLNSDFASSTWTPPAGLVHIRAAVTFTAGVDQTAYELKVYKNGLFYKRVARISASGTSQLQLGGEIYDMAADGDAYTVIVIQASGGNATVDGSSINTYFMGSSAY